MNPVTANRWTNMLGDRHRYTALRGDVFQLHCSSAAKAGRKAGGISRDRVWLFLPSADGAGYTVRRLAGKAAKK